MLLLIIVIGSILFGCIAIAGFVNHAKRENGKIPDKVMAGIFLRSLLFLMFILIVDIVLVVFLLPLVFR